MNKRHPYIGYCITVIVGLCIFFIGWSFKGENYPVSEKGILLIVLGLGIIGVSIILLLTKE